MAERGPSNAKQFDLEGVLEQIPFHSRTQARHNLSSIRELAPLTVFAPLITILKESANPDAAVNMFERLVRGNREVLLQMERYPYLVHYAVVVFSHSQWLGETLIQNADLFQSFVREHALDRVRSREELRESFARVRSRSLETDIALLLARFKRREYVRIMLRDLLSIATLAETTAEISALSDVLIEEALIYCDSAMRNRYGPPQQMSDDGRISETPFAVLSLGKLGGNELNYSSDVDLLYLYGSGQDLPAPSISNREYFVRLAQELTDVLSRLTREGPVFRIDLRLRPQGAEGEPAIGIQQAIRYYSSTAHDWELQALIKLRHSAGDEELARTFIREVQPYVYRGETNFAAVDTALQSRTRMSQRTRKGTISRRNDTIDVKLDRGGIRDIEFLVQCLQRVYGGTEVWLRSGGTLFSLQKLHDKGHISGKDFHELTNSYEFLRKIEHRLQLRAGQQTHRLPASKEELGILTYSVLGSEPNTEHEDLIPAVRTRMNTVAEIYHRIIHQQRASETAVLRLVPNPSEIEGGQSYEQIIARLATDSPGLYRISTAPDLSGPVRRNLYRFLGAARTSSSRYATVTGNPEAVERALPIFATSEYLTELLLRHPEEITALGHTVAAVGGGTRSLFEDPRGGEARDPVFDFVTESATEAMALLRRHYRHKVFRSAVRDLLEDRPVFASLQATSWTAEEAIRAAVRVAGCAESGFAVMALGRLATREFDILSDADLIFLRHESTDSTLSVRWAEKVMEVLSAYTQDGFLFPVDARLRPYGGEGELVCTPSRIREYFETEAQAWEALTYVKLRFIAGDRDLAQRGREALSDGIARFRGAVTTASDLHAMRKRLEDAESNSGVNLKNSAGAIYDLDFIAGYLELKANLMSDGLNMRERLDRLRRNGSLDEPQWRTLDSAAELLRATEHAVRLAVGKARKSLPVGESTLANVQRHVEGQIGRPLRSGIESELMSTLAEVRAVYANLLGD